LALFPVIAPQDFQHLLPAFTPEEVDLIRKKKADDLKKKMGWKL
jgi:hypothetical protein